MKRVFGHIVRNIVNLFLRDAVANQIGNKARVDDNQTIRQFVKINNIMGCDWLQTRRDIQTAVDYRIRQKMTIRDFYRFLSSIGIMNAGSIV